MIAGMQVNTKDTAISVGEAIRRGVISRSLKALSSPRSKARPLLFTHSLGGLVNIHW
jgi:hypothetical protein